MRGHTARRRTTVGLLSVDLAFLVLFWLRPAGLPTWAWALDRDRTLPELYGYTKLGGAALVLGWLAHRRRSWVAALWAVAVSMAVLDDANRFHERGGRTAARALALPSALRLEPQDHGELVMWAAMGFALCVPLFVAYRRADPWSRDLCRALVIPFGLLGVAAVGIDAGHQAAESVMGRMGTLAEDGTELVAQTLLLLSTASVLRGGDRSAVGTTRRSQSGLERARVGGLVPSTDPEPRTA